ncbi:tyrosine-type recombinase/integrase [Lacrimispora sp. AGF001]|uniref:tyrosine-type recombinase/integrase n=1 Tax=Lacrimispora sp. AGF001 TaxID=3401631 RepID=UPI003B434A26
MPKKRKDGRYSKQVTIGIKDGKPVKKTLYGKTIKELDKNYREFMSLKDKGIILQEENMTFKELSDLWIVNEKTGSVKDQTITNLKCQLKNINSYIGHIKVKDLKQSHIEEIRKAQIESGKIDQYNKGLTTIRSIVKYAVHKNIIANDITDGMPRIKYSGLKEKRSLTPEERQSIAKADLNEFEYCFINLLLYTGLRKSEALALNVSDIDIDKKNINVCKTLVSSKGVDDCLQNYPKTKAGMRKIPILAPLFPILKNYVNGKSGILFPSESGGYVGSSAFFKRWKQIIKKLQTVYDGVLPDDITAHTFRHTYASDLYKAGVDIKQAQYLLGHDDIKTTLDTYTHFGYVDVKIDKLESYYETVNKQSGKKIIPLKHA